MPIRDIQAGLREVGRIRCGDQVATGKGGRAPRKLDRFRFTADDRDLLGVMADLYGGTVERWEGAPSGDQWQVYATAERLPVMLVPGLAPLTQWWETWTGGGCVRRCDGAVETLTGEACPCLAGDRTCKPTTRLSVVLPEVPGLGTWRLETHGYYAAVELAGTVELLTRVVAATRQTVYGTLRLTQRTQRVQGQATRRFAVPTLDVNATVPDLAEIVNGQPGRPNAIDGSAATVLAEITAPVTPPSPGRFPTPEDLKRSEERRQAKIGRKRTPTFGPGRRGAEEPSPEEPPAPPPDHEIVDAFGTEMSGAQRRMMMALYRSTGVTDRAERLQFATNLVGRDITTSKDLTSEEASRIIDALAAVNDGSAEFVLGERGWVGGIQPVIRGKIVDRDIADEVDEADAPLPGFVDEMGADDP